MGQGNILLLAGGSRCGSLNEKLVLAASRIVQDAGWNATHLSLADYRLPLLGADPLTVDEIPAALELKDLFERHDAVLLANPEHNGSVSAMLKNAIDWLSCPSASEPPQAYRAFRRKAFGLMSASASPFGGLRGLSQLRHILTSVQAWVVPEQLSVPYAHRAFDEGGRLADPFLEKLLTDLVRAVIDVARR